MRSPWLSSNAIWSTSRNESPITLPSLLINVTLELDALPKLFASLSASSVFEYLFRLSTEMSNKFACFSSSSTICSLNVLVRSLSATTYVIEILTVSSKKTIKNIRDLIPIRITQAFSRIYNQHL